MKYSWLSLPTFYLSALVLLVNSGAAAEPGKGTPSFEPGIDLPAGEGRELVLLACTRCHDLKGVPAYKGYWNRARWQEMVKTMVQHGASLNVAQQDQIAAYLAENFGKESGTKTAAEIANETANETAAENGAGSAGKSATQ